MILIADSGSTKTDWSLIHASGPHHRHSVVATFRTQGITPIHQTSAEIRSILEKEMLHNLSTFPRAILFEEGGLGASPFENLTVYFYGSGCTPAHVPMMVRLLTEVFAARTVEVHSDLMAAARALCGHEAGIACILGTGGNSCLYDGEHIVQNTPALGYILGDEGSGAVLGRIFLNAVFKNPELHDVRDELLDTMKLTLPDIIRRVYREPMANRYLASFSPFIHDHLSHPLIREMVVGNFRRFFARNIAPYGRHDLPVSFVGSMAHHYPDELAEAARLEDYTIGSVLQSPMEGLVEYHR